MYGSDISHDWTQSDKRKGLACPRIVSIFGRRNAHCFATYTAAQFSIVSLWSQPNIRRPRSLQFTTLRWACKKLFSIVSRPRIAFPATMRETIVSAFSGTQSVGNRAACNDPEHHKSMSLIDFRKILQKIWNILASHLWLFVRDVSWILHVNSISVNDLHLSPF